jgi:3-deoxy-D-manno-octulosonate 8-phosphate phosphatase (KDO 8-P phosphatase)
MVKRILDHYTKEQVKRAIAVRAVFFEASGVFTDGKMTYDETGRETVSFSGKDGNILGHLKRAGIVIGVISSRESAVINKRCSDLSLDFCHQGLVDKASVFEKLVQHYKLKAKEVAFIGCDLDDLTVFSLAGLAACPSDAPLYIKDRAALVTSAKAGRGVVREVADLVLAARGELEKLLMVK